jgi:hypothetical protein
LTAAPLERFNTSSSLIRKPQETPIMKTRSMLTLTATAALLALTACGGGDSTPGAKSMTVRQQDTSKKAGAPTGDTGTMKMQEGNEVPKSGAKKP